MHAKFFTTICIELHYIFRRGKLDTVKLSHKFIKVLVESIQDILEHVVVEKQVKVKPRKPSPVLSIVCCSDNWIIPSLGCLQGQVLDIAHTQVQPDQVKGSFGISKNFAGFQKLPCSADSEQS